MPISMILNWSHLVASTLLVLLSVDNVLFPSVKISARLKTPSLIKSTTWFWNLMKKIAIWFVSNIPFKPWSIFQKIEGAHSFGPFNICHFLVVFFRNIRKWSANELKWLGYQSVNDSADSRFAPDYLYPNPFEFNLVTF